jgi:hypothetical protein
VGFGGQPANGGNVTLKTWGMIHLAKRVIRATPSNVAEATNRLDGCIRFLDRAIGFLGGAPDLSAIALGRSEEYALALILRAMDEEGRGQPEGTPSFRLMRYLRPWATTTGGFSRSAILAYHVSTRPEARIVLSSGQWTAIIPTLDNRGRITEREHRLGSADSLMAKALADTLLTTSGWILQNE